MQIKFLKKLAAQKKLYNRKDFPLTTYTPIGCSQDQINNLERACKVHLPVAYKEYLFLAGVEHQLYDSGIGFCYAELEDIQAEAASLLEEEKYTLEDDFWVIDILYNDQFHFFYLKDGENPAIYHWIGSDEQAIAGYKNGIKKVINRLSSYIEEMIPGRLERLVYAALHLQYKLQKMLSDSKNKR